MSSWQEPEAGVGGIGGSGRHIRRATDRRPLTSAALAVTVPPMPTDLRSRSLRLTLAALYALAMVVVGFAHRPVGGFAAAGIPAAQSAAYVLPGGIVADLCATDAAAPVHDAGTGVCDACLLTAAPGLVVAAAPALPGAAGPVLEPVPAGHLADPAARFAPVSRGPPSATIA